MRTALALSLLMGCSSCALAPHPDARGAIDAVQALFDGMRAQDVDAVRDLLCEDANFASVTMVDGRCVVRPSTASAFLASLARGGDAWVERMFAPEVDVRGDFAFAKMDYDFHRGDAFSHHGAEFFILAREQGAWRVASITYSVVRGGDRSPFGGL